MRFDRVKNTKRNIIYEVINRIVAVLLPFMVRTVMIYKLGSEYLGLDGLFTSILQVLNLAELGFGNAVVYNMYKPIAENDDRTICALLRLYKKIYRGIGFAILGIGVMLLPFLPRMVKGGYPERINIYALFLIYLGNTVLTYWMFAYKTALLNAFQRRDVISNIGTVTKVILNLLQILVLCAWQNYYIYLILMPISTILNNLLSAIMVKRLFPQYQCKGDLDKETRSRIKENVMGLTIYKFCQTSRNAFDSIFISMFLGLNMTAIYTNYFYITTAVTTIMVVVLNSMQAAVGNSIACETIEKNYLDFKRFDFLYMWIAGWCTVCLLILFQPFMKLWMGEDMLFAYPVVILLCFYFYALKMGDTRAVYADAAGLWWENRYRTIMESAMNVFLNYVLVQLWGIYGIIIATLVTLLIFGFAAGAQIAFQHYFKSKKLLVEYFVLHLKYLIGTFLAALGTFFMCNIAKTEGIGGFVLKMLLCCIVPNMIYLLLFFRTKEYGEAVPWILEILNLSKPFKFLIPKKLETEKNSRR